MPTLAGEVSPAIAIVEGSATRFPFRSWARQERFTFPREAEGFLSRCESAAEAFFATAFVIRPGVAWTGAVPADASGTQLTLQVQHGMLRIDAVARRDHVALAIEIDGLAYHGRKDDQITADYLRERRVLALGYVVVRFTAPEVFANAAECWSQIDVILTKHLAKRTR